MSIVFITIVVFMVYLKKARPNITWEIAMPRFMDLFAEHGVQATFYCIAESKIKTTENGYGTWSQGHEIGNHSLTHPYALTPLGSQRIDEVRLSREMSLKHPELMWWVSEQDTIRIVLSRRSAVLRPSLDTSVFRVRLIPGEGISHGCYVLRGRSSASILGPPSV